jgi:hypothetical protein
MTLRQRWKQTSLPNKLLIIVGGFAALSTGLSVAIAYWQYELAVKSSEDTARQINTLIAAAHDMIQELNVSNANQRVAIQNSGLQNKATLDSAAAIAGQQLSSEREGLRLERRAWVGPVGISVGNFAVGSKTVITVRIDNRGTTPALSTTARLQVKLDKASNGCNIPVGSEAETSSSVLFPNQGITLVNEHRVSLTEALMSALNRQPTDPNAIRLCVNIDVSYTDIFKTPHRSMFCGFVTQPKGAKTPIVGIGAGNCNQAT